MFVCIRFRRDTSYEIEICRSTNLFRYTPSYCNVATPRTMFELRYRFPTKGLKPTLNYKNIQGYSFTFYEGVQKNKQTNNDVVSFFKNRLFSVDSSYSNDGFWVKGIVFPPWRRVFEPTRGKCLWPSIIIIEQYSAHCTPYLAWPHMSTVKNSILNVDLYKKNITQNNFLFDLR